MSASQSNLSDSKIGFDLVVATTQASINVTMKEFLDGITAPEVIVCYVFDANNDLAPIDYDTLKANAKGSDPFAVPDGANPSTDQDLINLTAANFAGGFKARIGLPDMDPAQIPPIVTLRSGADAPVLFNLLCAEFQMTGFDFGPHEPKWTNRSQPSGAPWYFSANVKLNSARVDPKSQVPYPAVQARIDEMTSKVGADGFSIQQLFLDLDTAILQSTPTINNLPEGWPVWLLIQADFLGAYFKQCQKTGQPLLGYTIAVNQPDPTTLQLGAMSMEYCPLLDPSGNPIPNPTVAQQNAATLNYLCSTTPTPAVPVPFPWNWVEAEDVGSYSGILSVRRDIFVNFFMALINREVPGLCLDTQVSLAYDEYYLSKPSYTAGPAASPSQFTPVAPGAPDSDGFTSMLIMAFTSAPPGHDEEGSFGPPPLYDDMALQTGDFHYNLNGNVSFKDNLIRITMRAVVSMMFSYSDDDLHISSTLPEANYYDKTYTYVYALTVNSSGQLEVNPTVTKSDQSAAWNFLSTGGTGSWRDQIQDALTSCMNGLDAYLDNHFHSYGDDITRLINGSHSWVFPGGKAFVFTEVGFSDFQDLVARVIYADSDT